MRESTKITAKKMMDENARAGYFGYLLEEEKIRDRNTKAYTLPTNVDFEKRYQHFTMSAFEYVDDNISDHLFGSDSKYFACVTQDDVMKDIEKLKAFLPTTDEKIFVRATRANVPLLRVVIIGAKGTPYQDGLFFFDIRFSYIYPDEEPFVRYHSFGHQINPSIYTCGELLWTRFLPDDDAHKWKSNESDISSLLLLIRDGFLNENPLFNQDAYRNCDITPFLEEKSVLYNENIIIKSLQTMVSVINKPPKHFEDLVIGHFRTHAIRILTNCQDYINGGFLKNELKKFCSITFRNEVAACINKLVDAFDKIGVTDANNFRHLSEKSFPIPAKPSLGVCLILVAERKVCEPKEEDNVTLGPALRVQDEYANVGGILKFGAELFNERASFLALCFLFDYPP